MKRHYFLSFPMALILFVKFRVLQHLSLCALGAAAIQQKRDVGTMLA